MMILKLDVIRLANEDVITTSGIDHTEYLHYLISKTNWNDTIYETGHIYKWSAKNSKFEYFNSFNETLTSIDIPNAKTGEIYINVNDTWIKCEENHILGN